MTIENARALQERLENEAIVQQKSGSRELADDCIRSIAVVGKAWGIPADETAHWQVYAHNRNKRSVLATLDRERTQQAQTCCTPPPTRL